MSQSLGKHLKTFLNYPLSPPPSVDEVGTSIILIAQTKKQKLRNI